MIISHQHKYVFVELPLTGSTAISQELRANYEGTRILRKHSTYYDFLRVASTEEKSYFIFSCIRNPLDSAVSRYYKLKTNHHERYTDPTKQNKRRTVAEIIEARLFNFVHDRKADFPSFFLKFYVLPYNNWADLAHKDFDAVIRFENLQEDFAKTLKQIGIEPKGPLPVINRTAERDGEFIAHYTPETIRRAKGVFGPFMKKWGYAFPSEWGDSTIRWWHQTEFEVLNLFRFFYWKHLRSRI
jgi:hypothetical protein